MSTKQSDFTDHLLGGAAAGGGAFAVGQLIQELTKQQEAKKRKAQQNIPANALVIDMPKKAELTDEFLKQANEIFSNFAGAAVGIPAGFAGTKVLYDHWRKKQNDKELAKSNAKYLQTLQAASKTAEDSTPFVDALCEGLSTTLEKDAGAMDVLKSIGQRAASVPGKWWNSPGGKYTSIGTAGALGLEGYLNHVTPSPKNSATGVWGSIKDIGKIIAALSAVGTGGALINAARTKENKEIPKVPSAVALNYQEPQLDPMLEPQLEPQTLSE